MKRFCKHRRHGHCRRWRSRPSRLGEESALIQVTPAAQAPLARRAATVAPAKRADRDAYARIQRQRLDRRPGRGSRLRQPLAAAAKYAAIALMGLVLAPLLTPLPELFGWQIFAVQTGSMEPAIPVGSLIAVQPVRAADLAEGDVITFSERTRPDVRVTHRIVTLETKEGQRVAVTKGDANNSTHSWNVPLNEAIGRVAFHVPFMGYVLA